MSQDKKKPAALKVADEVLEDVLAIGKKPEAAAAPAAPEEKKEKRGREEDADEEDGKKKKQQQQQKKKKQQPEGDEEEAEAAEGEEEDAGDDDVEGKGYKQVVYTTSVPKSERLKLLAAGRTLKAHFTKDISLATHVVYGGSSPSADADARRTLAVMMAAVRGLWVLSGQWLLKSAAAKAWLPEADFEPAAAMPGVKLNREKASAKAPLIFAGLSFVVGPNTQPPAEEIRRLIKAGGGRVLANKELATADFYVEATAADTRRKTLPPGCVTRLPDKTLFDCITVSATAPVKSPEPMPPAAIAIAETKTPEAEKAPAPAPAPAPVEEKMAEEPVPPPVEEKKPKEEEKEKKKKKKEPVAKKKKPSKTEVSETDA